MMDSFCFDITYSLNRNSLSFLVTNFRRLKCPSVLVATGEKGEGVFAEAKKREIIIRQGLPLNVSVRIAWKKCLINQVCRAFRQNAPNAARPW
jgi:uncharacterized FAD-dependent dehydrogenase